MIGGGIGGTATAFYLNRLFSPSAGVNVTLFELGVVGGRLATIKMAGHEYEVGGSIIHPKNKLIKDLVEELGEERRRSSFRTLFFLKKNQGSWQA